MRLRPSALCQQIVVCKFIHRFRLFRIHYKCHLQWKQKGQNQRIDWHTTTSLYMLIDHQRWSIDIYKPARLEDCCFAYSFVVLVLALILPRGHSLIKLFLYCSQVSPKGSYAICVVICCRINLKKSPAKNPLLSLYADFMTEPYWMETHMWIDEVFIVRVRQRLDGYIPFILVLGDIML